MERQRSPSQQGAPGFDPADVWSPDIDPLAPPRLIEFDWEILRRLMGEAKEDAGGHDFALLGSILGDLLRWVVRGDLRGDKLRTIGRRAIALAWVINPDILNGLPVTKLAKQLGLRRAGLSDETADVRRTFKVQNRAQAHDWKFGGTETKRKRKTSHATEKRRVAASPKADDSPPVMAAT